MALPGSRSTTYAAGAQVKSADLNAIQDAIIAEYTYRTAGVLAGVSLALSGALTAAGALRLSSILSPTTLGAGAVENYNPAGLSSALLVRLGSSDVASIGGLAGGAAGRLLIIVNTNSTDSISLVHASGSSSAANQIYIASSANYILRGRQCAILFYDGTLTKWRVVGGTGEVATTRTQVFATHAGVVMSGSPDGPATRSYGWQATAGGDKVRLGLGPLEAGRRITACGWRGYDDSAAAFARGELFRYDAAGGTISQIGPDMDSSTGSTGFVNKKNTGLSEDIDDSRVYLFEWTAGANDDTFTAVYVATEPIP